MGDTTHYQYQLPDGSKPHVFNRAEARGRQEESEDNRDNSSWGITPTPRRPETTAPYAIQHTVLAAERARASPVPIVGFRRGA